MVAGDPFLSWVLTYNTSYLLLAIGSTLRSYLILRSTPLRDDGDTEIYRIESLAQRYMLIKGRAGIQTLEVFPVGWG